MVCLLFYVMKIKQVNKQTSGEELGLLAGDDITRINGNPVRDILDYRFLIADEDLEMEVVRSGEKMLYEIEKDFDDDLGLDFDEIEIRFCGNDCPFCFVDQNPAGMRSTMYFRDEDFRLSFLSGHYVTLTNLSKRDIDRIVWQRLSPLFVSVHATEPEVRKFLFGIKHHDRLLEKLDYLVGHDIEIHTQVVLCPGINDGEILEKTIQDLAQFRPNLKSIAVVPIGLTKHRKGLTKLTPVTPEYARKFIQIADERAVLFKKETGEYYIYSSDEFYIMAGQELPAAERYDGFYQKENGIGMVRYLLDDFAGQRKLFPQKLARGKKATFVTASLASGFMAETILPALNQVENFHGELCVVENQFYGTSIHVTGLLTGQDIYAAVSKKNPGDTVYLPANCLKDETLFLDDWTLEDLSRKLHCPVVPLQNDFRPVFEMKREVG